MVHWFFKMDCNEAWLPVKPVYKILKHYHTIVKISVQLSVAKSFQ
jgi:hypothetical protein